MKPVIFDTDIGIDDAMALLFLHCAPEVDIMAITTRFGNASIDDTTRNALAVAEQFNIAAPVFRGAEAPMGERLGEGFPDHVHGKDGLGDINLPLPALKEQAETAEQALVSLSKSSTQKVTIVSVGGLTNIAKALELDPTLPNRIEELIVMGGAFGYKGHSGNVSPVAEANIASDPLAADIVFTSGMKTTIVGLDVTHEVVVDGTYIENLASESGAMGKFIKESSHYYLEFHRSISSKYECPLHDSCAVAYLVAPELFDTISEPVRVVTNGIAIGQTIHGNDLRKYVSTEWNSKPKCTVCISVDSEAVLKLFYDTIVSANKGQ